MDNIEKARETLQTIEQKDSNLTKWFGNIQITNTKEQKNYEEILASAKIALKQVTDIEDGLLKPLKETANGIKNLFKPKKDEYAKAITQISDILNKWRKEQKELTEAQITQQAETFWKQQKETKETGEVIPLPDLGMSVLSKTSTHNMGSTSYIPHIHVTIVKSSLVPREYCVPAESLLRKAGEMALAQEKPMPAIDGVILEVTYTPRSNPIRS